MSTTDIALNLGILALVILTGYGRRIWDLRRLLLPIGIVAAVGFLYLPGAPTMGRDVAFDGIGIAVGILFGLAAAAFVPVEREESGQVFTRAGIGYVAIWGAVVCARLLFAWGSDHAWAEQIRDFSIAHQITGPDAYRIALVLMALAMVLTRAAATAAWATIAARRPAIIPSQQAA